MKVAKKVPTTITQSDLCRPVKGQVSGPGEGPPHLPQHLPHQHRVEQLQSLSDEYERTEADFLSAVRTEADHATLAGAARRVATTASAFNAEAYRKYHASEEDAWTPLAQLTERTEVLAELWIDLAAAYEH